MIFFEIVREARFERVDSRMKLIEVYSSQYIQRINPSAKNSLPALLALWKFYFTLKPPTITFPSKPNTYTPLHDPL